MKPKKNNLILRKQDYDLLTRYVFTRMDPSSGESRNAEQLYDELLDAKILDDDEDFPENVVQLHAEVTVEEIKTGKETNFRLVMPDQSNLKKGRLSIFAPLAIALIGYREGDVVDWQMPSGKKKYLIKKVLKEQTTEK